VVSGKKTVRVNEMSCHDVCILAVITAPTDVHVRRLSATSVEVQWQPPALHSVAGYRVQYGAVTDGDDDHPRRPRFLDTGPYTVAQVSTIVHVIIMAILGGLSFLTPTSKCRVTRWALSFLR